MSEQKLSPQAKATIKIVFLTLFLDIVGFSIIFPLFPKLVDFYLKNDPTNFFLKSILDLALSITSWAGSPQTVSPIVLFGGILGALYSLLQFIFAPIWGGISDRIGRRPVLMISVAGIALSYIIWFYSGNFTLLIISRVLSGMMGGNISTATAAVGDVTSPETRSRGMAFVGIAIGTGFIFGPAIGGLASLLDLSVLDPSLAKLGVNPFSFPAAIAFTLALANFLIIAKLFAETLPKDSSARGTIERSFNPLKLFAPLPNANINLSNLSNFFFLTIFSGMEFTLTFLALDRLGYGSFENGMMFIFIGVLVALIQGGYVRRKARTVGEKRMSLMGLVTVIPGFICLAYATNNLLFYIGLAFLAVGVAMVNPCLTSLVSLFADKDVQGKALGIFRSLGSLARVFGPLLGGIFYWRFGAQSVYLVGAVAVLIPILFVARIQQSKAVES